MHRLASNALTFGTKTTDAGCLAYSNTAMYTPTVTAADWTSLDRDIWTRIFAAIPAFRQKVLCQQVCKAWLFDLRDRPAHGVWGSKLTLKYDCDVDSFDSCKAAVAHGSGGSLVISLGTATGQFHVVQWILKRAVGWQQIRFWDAEGLDPLHSSDRARNALAYSLQWLLLELQKLDAPSLSIRIQGQCPV